MTTPTTSAAPSGTVRADVRPCEFTGLTDCDACPASRCFYEPDGPDEYDRETCDSCGGTSPAMLNGLCPMCYETGGGVLLHGPRPNTVLSSCAPDLNNAKP